MMYDELVAVLRHCGSLPCEGCPRKTCEGAMANMCEAADAIEDLAYQNAKWEKAVKTVLDFIPCWTSVTERLPLQGQYVLASYKSISGAMRAVSYWFLDDRNKVRWGGENELFVTHWMPLPPAPEPIEEEG